MRKQLRAYEIAKYLNTQTSITDICKVFWDIVIIWSERWESDWSYLYVESAWDTITTQSAKDPIARQMLIQITVVAPKNKDSWIPDEEYVMAIIDEINDVLVWSWCFALHDIGNSSYIDWIEQWIWTPILYVNKRAYKKQNYLVTYWA